MRVAAVVASLEVCFNCYGMTEAENLFERFCRERDIQLRRLEESDFKTPDYEIRVDLLSVAVEVKQFEPTAKERKLIQQLRQNRSGAYHANMDRPRNSILSAAKQLRAHMRRRQPPIPAMVVLYDTLDGLLGYLDSDNIAQCMYGPECFHFRMPESDSEFSQYIPEFVGASLGGKRIVTDQHNTILSAVAVLRFEQSANYLSMRVFHNRYALVPLQPSYFRVSDVTHFSHVSQGSRTLPQWVRV